MLDRIMGVITLKAPKYREIADDKTATGQAAIIVVVVSILVGFISTFLKTDPTGKSYGIVAAVAFAVLGLIVALIGWWLGSWIAAFVAKSFFQGKTDTGEMLRVFGYTYVFNILGIIPVLAIVGAILGIIGTVIGIREAAEFDTTKAILTAIIAGVIEFIIITVLTAILVGIVVVGMLAAGGGS